MKPTRAAWLFAIGLAWLVLRGILVQAVPVLDAGQIGERGGLLLLIPVASLAAALTAPNFFIAFLRHHEFSGERGLRSATILAIASSITAAGLVAISLVALIGGQSIDPAGAGGAASWLVTIVPFVFVLSIFVFLLAASRASSLDDGIRTAARVGAIGTAIPIILIVAWIAHSHFGLFAWYPEFSQSIVARALGLLAAAALFWFLETFATRYDSGFGQVD